MREVAARAGVSIATVSFVVNGTKAVSEPTRRAVTEAMRELGYRNNVVARALASKRTRIIALLFPGDVLRLSRIALEIFMSAATRAAELGYHLVLWPTGVAPDEVADLVSGRLVDGVIVMEVRMDDARIRELAALDVPYVSIGRTADTRDLPFVDMDFEGTVAGGLDHLQGLGHRRFGLVVEDLEDGPLRGYGPTTRTERAFREETAARGRAGAVARCAPTPTGGRAAAAELLAADPGITAVMILNDQAARGLLSGLDAAGRRVPDDVSILSLASSTEVGALVEPALSTMDAPGPELGRLAVETLLARLDGTAAELPHALLPCRLHEAASTGPAPAAR
jgi:DNA-binding LacI/PurR family transcriptional regulator